MSVKYTISIKSSNPDFQNDKRLRDGIEADGYLLVLFDKDGNAVVETINAVSTMKIAEYLAADNGRVSNILRQADAIADGLMKAREIQGRFRREKMAKDLASLLGAKEQS